MKLTGETKLFLGIILGTIVIIGAAVMLLSKPEVALTKADLITQDTPTKGPSDAKVFLVEFSDFQCPACKAAQPVVDDIVKTYKDKVLFAYHHYPLDQHPFAQKAAEAAEAARAQGKFWEMHDLLFLNQEKFSDTLFSDLAKQLDLDMEKFDTALKNRTHTQRVLDDKAFGNTVGIEATPTFFLNGKRLNLATFAELKPLVDEAIKQN